MSWVPGSPIDCAAMTPHGLADLDHLARGEHAAVAEAADAALGLAGQNRADLDPLDTGLLDERGEILGDLVADPQDLLLRERVVDVFLGHAADDAVAQGLERVAAFHDRGDRDAVRGAAVLLDHDDVLSHVDEPARQVAGVGRLQRRVGETLAGAVRRDEVLEDREALAEVRRDGRLDDLARRLGHEAAHAGELAHLLLGASGARVGHDVDRVELRAHLVGLLHLLEHLVGDVLGRPVPDVDDLVVALAGRDDAGGALRLDLDDLLAGGREELFLLGRDDHVVDADRDARAGGRGKAQVLQVVEHLDRHLLAEGQVDVADEVRQASLLQVPVDERDDVRQGAVENDAPDRRVDQRPLDVLDLGVRQVLVVVLRRQIGVLARVAHADGGVRRDVALLEGQDDFVEVGEDAPLALRARAGLGQVVDAEHQVLRGDGERPARSGREDVVGGEHQELRLDLGLGRQRDVHGHLVAVEVRVEGRADEGMDLDGLSLDQHRLEGLDAEAVERRRAVQEHRVVADDLLESIPNVRHAGVHELLGRLDRRGEALLLEAVVDERLEQLDGHLLGQARLVELQLRPHDDDRTARVVDALAEQVLAEPSLLALQRVREGLQGPVVRALEHPAAAAVVEQGVHRLLEHALLVAHDDLGSAQLEQLLQPVVPVDDAAVEVVEIRRRETAAVQGHEGPQLRRDDRDDVQDHPIRMVAGTAEGVAHLEALGRLLALDLRRLRLHDHAQLFRHHLDVHALEQLLDRARAHPRHEHVAVLPAQGPVALLGEQLFLLQLRLARVDDDVGLEVQDALEVPQRDVEQVPDPRRQPLEEPDVRDRGGELDVRHPLAADLGLGHLDAALVADDAAVLHPLVLAAEAFPVGDRAEDLRAEEPVPLRLERAVVDGLGLGDLAVGPRPDSLGRRQRDLDRVEVLQRCRLVGKSERVQSSRSLGAMHPVHREA